MVFSLGGKNGNKRRLMLPSMLLDRVCRHGALEGKTPAEFTEVVGRAVMRGLRDWRTPV